MCWFLIGSGKHPGSSFPAIEEIDYGYEQRHLEKLRIDEEDCALISKLATDMQKRVLAYFDPY